MKGEINAMQERSVETKGGPCCCCLSATPSLRMFLSDREFNSRPSPRADISLSFVKQGKQDINERCFISFIKARTGRF